MLLLSPRNTQGLHEMTASTLLRLLKPRLLSLHEHLGCIMQIFLHCDVDRGGLGQNFRPGSLTLIQAIPYTHNKFWNMDNLLAYLYDHHIKRSKSLVGLWKIIKGSLLNCTFTSLFLFFVFSNISVTPFFLVPVTSLPAGLLLLTELCSPCCKTTTSLQFVCT